MRKILLATAALAAIGIAPASAATTGHHFHGGGGGIGVLGALALSGALGGGAYGAYSYGYSGCNAYGYTYTPYGQPVACAPTVVAPAYGVNPFLFGLGGGRHWR